jgi:hypothetical protein
MERMWMSVKMQNVILHSEDDDNNNYYNTSNPLLVGGLDNSATTRTPADYEDDVDDKYDSYEGLAITTAFNHRNDSFKGTGPINASFGYIEKWYKSVQRHHPAMQGVVLHNMFSQEDARHFSNDKIRFLAIPNTTESFYRGRNRPINDMRFFVLETVIANVPRMQLPNYVLISDAHDVSLLRNPFEYMIETDRLLGERQLYVGEESLFSNRKKTYDAYMNKSSVKCFGKELPHTARMVNCGLIGGHYTVVLELLKRMNRRMDKATPHKVCDQISFWYVLQKDYQNKYISGYPFNSMFMKYEAENDTLAYIAHK